MPSDFPGKRSIAYPGPQLCHFCDDIAIYRGAGMKNNDRVLYYLCIYHGPEALKTHVATHVDELKEFKEWKRKKIAEAKTKHPSNNVPQLRLVNDDE